MGILPIAGMDAHRTVVSAALAAKSSAEMPRKARWESRSETGSLHSVLVILVVAPPPDTGFVATLGRAVKPLVHPPQAIHSARVGGIGVIDDAFLENERA